jgi:putative addiction module component (TIGR02574 family)
MGDPAKILAEAMTLPEREREELALELLASLPKPQGELADDDPAFAEEIQRRVAEVRAGNTQGVSWEELRASIEDRRRR